MGKSCYAIKIELTNAQSLLGHFEEMKMVAERNIDVLSIGDILRYQEMPSYFNDI